MSARETWLGTPPARATAVGPARAALVPGFAFQHYELIRELGRGGMGQVFAARDTRLGRRVAIKFLLDASREVADRFLVEARATAQCSHEHIVDLYDVGELDGQPYMVLEYLEGTTLRALMELGAFPPARVVEWMVPVARALARAHEIGVVHRDLKPENVFLTSAGQIKVLDFGIARALGDDEAPRRAFDRGAARTNLTEVDTFVGTPPYMSPEQLETGRGDHRGDLWAMGIMMYELLVGAHPIEADTLTALIVNIIAPEPMPSVRARVPEVPAELDALVARCLAKDPAARIATATELADALAQLAPGRRTLALAGDESPYLGLTAFQERDAARFFGRAREVARVAARIADHPVLALVGASGSGKSSFVRAGLVPALKASGERWTVLTLRPGRHPIAALANAFERTTTRVQPGVATDDGALVRRLAAEPGYLGVRLRELARATGDQLLVFVDQFEELYTLVPDAAERRAFTAALAGAADDPSAPVRVVVSMRSDLLDRVGEDPRFLEEITRGLVFLAPPDRAGLREALVQPAELAGVRFETPAMVDDMLDALATTPGALPLLQFAAAKLWDARDRARRLITEHAYRAIGGVTGALATHADEVVGRMPTAAQRVVQRVFQRLVTPERTRAIVELSDLEQLVDRAELARVLEQLVAARLVVVQALGDSSSVEIVHESLIVRWPALRRWLDEDSEDAAYVAQLAAAAKQWDAKGRPHGLLWRGAEMDELRRWSTARPRTLGAREREFVDAVLALARRSRRARRAGLVAAFATLVAIAAGASIAYVRVRAAERDATENAAHANDALARLQDEKRQRDEAAAAERAAKAAKARVEAEKDRIENVNRMTGEELAVRNEELRAALAEAKAAEAKAEQALHDGDAARERALRASEVATRARDEAQAAKAQLEKALEQERARVRALEDERRKLSTKLKE